MVPSSKGVLDTLVTQRNKGAGKQRARLSEVSPNTYKPKPLQVHRQMPLHSGYISALELGSRTNHRSSTYLIDWENYLTALHLNFLICKTGMITVPSP